MTSTQSPAPELSPPAGGTSPQPPAAAGGPRWERVGGIEGGGGRVTSFDQGYVAFGSSAELATAWFSADGRDWQQTTFGSMFTPCPSWVPRADFSTVYHGAAEGGRMLLVGTEEYRHAEPTCGTDYRPAAWVSSDGLNWERSEDIRNTGHGSWGVRQVWAVDGGWEAMINSWDEAEENVIWRSADGLQWAEVVSLGYADLVAISAAPDGTRLLATADENGDSYRVMLARSTGDGTWHEVTAPFTGSGHDPYVTHIVPPTPGGPQSWLLVTGTEEGGATTWATPDLEHWQSAEFARPDLQSVVGTRLGYVADAIVECRLAGESCPPPRQRQFLSTDGLAWTAISPRLTGDLHMVDGPSGVLLVGEELGSVWKLEP